MHPVVSILKKELIELTADRSSRRGGLVQTAIIVAVLGVALPYSHAALWAAGDVVPAFFFAVLPGIPAVIVAADAIAGERERRTLATLLATPLRESTLLFGKWLAATIVGVVVTLLSLVAASVVVCVTTTTLALSPALLGGALFAGIGSSALMASVAVVVSMRSSSARAAQQVASVLSLAVGFGIGRAGAALGIAPTWPILFGASATALGLGVAVLLVAATQFRRERLLDVR